MLRILQLIILIALSGVTLSAQGFWKGFDMTRTTDAFSLEVPVGTNCVMEEVYGSYKAYNREPSVDGKLLSSTEYELDDNGYYIKEGEKVYKNIYNADGLIEKRDIYIDGKLSEQWIYKYMYDEKGPGVGIEKYDSDGDVKGAVVWQGNLYYSEAPGGNVKYKLNDSGRMIEGTITVTNYRDEVKINQIGTYNDHGYLESTTMVAPGRSQVIDYSDYIYDENGQWIQRYSNSKLYKRKILSKEEYKNHVKQRQAEAERKKREEIAQKVEILKHGFANNGTVSGSTLTSLPKAEIIDVAYEYENLPYSVTIDMVLPDKVTTVPFNWHQTKLFSVRIEEPAQFTFPNDSVGYVPSKFHGEISSKFIRKKRFPRPIEIKIGFDKKTNEWVVKDAEKLLTKYDLSAEEVDALKARVAEKGKEQPYKFKKLYFAGLFQISTTIESDEDSALKISKTVTFPIRFLIVGRK